VVTICDHLARLRFTRNFLFTRTEVWFGFFTKAQGGLRPFGVKYGNDDFSLAERFGIKYGNDEPLTPGHSERPGANGWQSLGLRRLFPRHSRCVATLGGLSDFVAANGRVR
jgi:hypothetical protein